MYILGPVIKKFKSTGVYFTDASIHPSLPLLPGNHIKGVDCKQPLMIGEFESSKGNKYVMVVNLSLEKSARFILDTKVFNERLYIVSAGEATPYFTEIIPSKDLSPTMKGSSKEQIEMANQKAYWLPAGQGVLIKCSGTSGE